MTSITSAINNEMDNRLAEKANEKAPTADVKMPKATLSAKIEKVQGRTINEVVESVTKPVSDDLVVSYAPLVEEGSDVVHKGSDVEMTQEEGLIQEGVANSGTLSELDDNTFQDVMEPEKGIQHLFPLISHPVYLYSSLCSNSSFVV